MLQEILQQLRQKKSDFEHTSTGKEIEKTRGEQKKTKPWTLKVVLRPSRRLTCLIQVVSGFFFYGEEGLGAEKKKNKNMKKKNKIISIS